MAQTEEAFPEDGSKFGKRTRCGDRAKTSRSTMKADNIFESHAISGDTIFESKDVGDQATHKDLNDACLSRTNHKVRAGSRLETPAYDPARVTVVSGQRILTSERSTQPLFSRHISPTLKAKQQLTYLRGTKQIPNQGLFRLASEEEKEEARRYIEKRDRTKLLPLNNHDYASRQHEGQDVETDIIDCPCNNNVDDGSVFTACDQCGTWQHNHCVGLSEKVADIDDEDCEAEEYELETTKDCRAYKTRESGVPYMCSKCMSEKKGPTDCNVKTSKPNKCDEKVANGSLHGSNTLQSCSAPATSQSFILGTRSSSALRFDVRGDAHDVPNSFANTGGWATKQLENKGDGWRNESSGYNQNTGKSSQRDKAYGSDDDKAIPHDGGSFGRQSNNGPGADGNSDGDNPSDPDDPSSPPVQPAEPTKKVVCPCGNNRELPDRAMFQCYSCETFQHNVCVHLPNRTKLRTKGTYLCPACQSPEEKEKSQRRRAAATAKAERAATEALTANQPGSSRQLPPDLPQPVTMYPNNNNKYTAALRKYEEELTTYKSFCADNVSCLCGLGVYKKDAILVHCQTCQMYQHRCCVPGVFHRRPGRYLCPECSDDVSKGKRPNGYWVLSTDLRTHEHFDRWVEYGAIPDSP